MTDAEVARVLARLVAGYPTVDWSDETVLLYRTQLVGEPLDVIDMAVTNMLGTVRIPTIADLSRCVADIKRDIALHQPWSLEGPEGVSFGDWLADQDDAMRQRVARVFPGLALKLGVAIPGVNIDTEADQWAKS